MGLSLSRFGGVSPSNAANMDYNKFAYYYEVIKDEFEAKSRKKNSAKNLRLVG